MPTTWHLRSTNTTGLPTTGATLTEWPIRDITAASAASTTSALVIATSATEIGYGYTEASTPGAAGINGTWTVEVNVTTANTVCFVAIQIHRVNSAGTVQASSTTTAEQATTPTGVKTFAVDCSGLGTWAATDRARVDYRFRNSNTMTAQGPTVTLNTADAQVIMPDALDNPVYYKNALRRPKYLWR